MRILIDIIDEENNYKYTEAQAFESTCLINEIGPIAEEIYRHLKRKIKEDKIK